ncbi:MAG: TMEM175 family protein [Herpetosiphon sp.]
MARTPSTNMETTRLEAFSDGVFAVAITLLALNLGVPSVKELHEGFGLVAALLAQWPVYLAYTLSFLSILIMWVNHHGLFRLIRRTDHSFLLLNGLLLLIITATPFATALLATYLLHPDRRIALVVYTGLSFVMAMTYNGMWAYASRGGRLLDPSADPEMVQSITEQYRFGPLLYLIAFGLAFISATASLGLCVLLALFFAFPSAVTRALYK